jgi:hypothetical protein
VEQLGHMRAPRLLCVPVMLSLSIPLERHE